MADHEVAVDLGDILQGVDEDSGRSIERAIQKWVSKDSSRRLAKEAIKFIGEQIQHEICGCDPETTKVNRLQDKCRG